MSEHAELSKESHVPPPALQADSEITLDDSGNLGAIQCDKSVFRQIVTSTAQHVEGIVYIGGRSTLSDKLGFRDKDARIEIGTSDDSNEVSISLSCHLLMDTNIYDVCSELQRRIKNSIESITNYSVESVNIKVEGLIPPDQTESPDEEQAG